jgi:hypothetical protein
MGPYGGFFARGQANLGTEGTIIDAEWLNMLQEEMCNVVLMNTTNPLDKSDRTQLVQTIIEIAPGGPGTGTGGAMIPEPPDDNFAHSRYRFVPDPGPPATGGWWHALKEPPVSPTANIGYSRTRLPGEIDGEWVISAGRIRPVTPPGAAAVFYVEKNGRNGDMIVNPGDGTQARPWRTIQYAIDWIAENIDAGGEGVQIFVGPHDMAGSTAPWEGFEVIQSVVGCPPDKFQIIGNTNNPALCQLGQITSGANTRCCVYANGGRVNIQGFSFYQPLGLTPYTRGVAVLSEGVGSTVKLDGNCHFNVAPGTLDHLWANAGGIIRVHTNYTINTGGALTAQQQNHMHVSNGGMILFQKEPLTINFAGICFCVNFVLAECGGIARLRAAWTAIGTAQPTAPATNMKKWYVSGNGVVDVHPDFLISAPNVWQTALIKIPGVTPVGQGGPGGQTVWTGGRALP